MVPVKFRQVVMSACNVYPLEGHINEQRTLFRILAQFWWPVVNKEVLFVQISQQKPTYAKTYQKIQGKISTSHQMANIPAN